MAHTKYSPSKKLNIKNLRQKGKSIREISIITKIPRSTVRSWVKDVRLSDKDRNRLYSKNIDLMKNAESGSRKRSQIRKINMEKEAMKLLKTTNDLTYLVAGAMLYWAEGDKTKAVSFTNSDPVMIEFMVDWLRYFFHIPDKNFELRLHIHDSNHEQKAIRYWCDICKLSRSNFRKSYLKSKGTGHRKNILQNGIIRVRVCGTGTTNLLTKILTLSNKYAGSNIRP